MRKISDFGLAQKLMNSKKRGLIIGIAIGVFVCLIAIAAVIKFVWLKKKFECLHYDLDGLDDMECEFADLDGECDCDENGCSYTSDKDFV